MSSQTRLLIISGLSGSGKSVALHVLEDLGYYCIDNMPAALLKSVVNEVMQQEEHPEVRVAVGVDARNREGDLKALPSLIDDLQRDDVTTELLFLQADDEVLLKRFSETRRRHPLAEPGTELRQAIELERNLLGPVINAADLIIDTTHTSVYELAEAIRDRVDRRSTNTLSVLIESFGFKHGIPADADFVFDVRCLPNPHWEENLKPLSGRDRAVIKYLESYPDVAEMYESIYQFLTTWIPRFEKENRSYMAIAIGCTGGKHRSVYLAERLADAFRQQRDNLSLRHRDLK